MMAVSCVLSVLAAAVMALAFYVSLRMGFLAGASDEDERLGFGALALCMLAMLVQALLWSLWGLSLGRGLA